jgi:hypothetical protein
MSQNHSHVYGLQDHIFTLHTLTPLHVCQTHTSIINYKVYMS